MQISVAEALRLLEHLQKSVDVARERAGLAQAERDALIRELDGQPGMTRSQMAASLGMSRQALLVIAQRAKPDRESLVDGVPMSEALYEQLVAVIGHFATNVREQEAVRLDVDA